MANTKAEAPIGHHFPEETANYLIAGWLYWIPSVTDWVAICLHCNRHVFWMCIYMFCPQGSAIILYHYWGLIEWLMYQQSIPYNFAFCFWPRKHFKGKKKGSNGLLPMRLTGLTRVSYRRSWPDRKVWCLTKDSSSVLTERDIWKSGVLPYRIMCMLSIGKKHMTQLLLAGLLLYVIIHSQTFFF